MKTLKKFFKTVYDIVERIAKRISDDRVTVYAAQATFFIVISAIPFIMLLLSLLRYIVPLTGIDFSDSAESIFPAGIIEFARAQLDELNSRSGIPVLSFSAVTLLWASARGLRSISEGIRNVYGGVWRQKYGLIAHYVASLVYTLIFILLIILTLLVLVFGEKILGFITAWRPEINYFADLFIALRGGVFLVLMTVIFLLAYIGMSRAGMRIKDHFPGAVFSAVGWMGFSWGYSIYIDNFAHYSYIYGSLTAIILMMLWMYMCMVILLLGAELNMWIAGIKKHPPERSAM